MGAMRGAMRRRDFIRLAGAATAWPLAAQRTSHAAFLQSLKQLGWVDGQNVRIETRWADGTASLIRKNVTDVLALAPNAVVVRRQ